MRVLRFVVVDGPTRTGMVTCKHGCTHSSIKPRLLGNRAFLCELRCDLANRSRERAQDQAVWNSSLSSTEGTQQLHERVDVLSQDLKGAVNSAESDVSCAV